MPYTDFDYISLQESWASELDEVLSHAVDNNKLNNTDNFYIVWNPIHADNPYYVFNDYHWAKKYFDMMERMFAPQQFFLMRNV